MCSSDLSREETVYELADLCYHALVLMAHCGVTPDDVRRELASRHVVDHKVKQEQHGALARGRRACVRIGRIIYR